MRKLEHEFQRYADLLGQTPVQAHGRDHLRELLNRASGGVIFTTIHKFMPEKGKRCVQCRLELMVEV